MCIYTYIYIICIIRYYFSGSAFQLHLHYFFHTKLFYKVWERTANVREVPVVSIDLIWQYNVGNENKQCV